MNDAVVVLEDREDCAELLREAAIYAAGADTELVLYAPLTEEEYENAVEALDQISSIENHEYSGDNAIATARQFARKLADEVLSDRDVEWTVVAEVVDEIEASRIVEVAESNDCDHVFTLGRRRSPTGKAVFGDRTQRLILNFPGYVTVKTE